MEAGLSKIVVVDTETGGLDPNVESILSIGMVIMDSETGELGERYYSLIDEPNLVANPRALEVNGLTVEQIKAEGKSPQEVCRDIDAFLRRHSLKKPTLAGHNIAGFDMGFIRRLYRVAGVKWLPFDYHVLDTMSVAVLLRFNGHLPVEKVSLDNLCQHFGINIREGGEGAQHNALEDAVATAKLLNALTVFIGTPSASPKA
jgi:DNA polymerase III epsilon subunit-like protein